jgi:hypothetical protein
MFGMFAKPDLSLNDRSLLMLTLLLACLMGQVKHNEWLAEIHRAKVIDKWLKKNQRTAGSILRYKMSSAADEWARSLVATKDPDEMHRLYKFLDMSQTMKLGICANDDKTFYWLMGECERIVIAKGLA